MRNAIEERGFATLLLDLLTRDEESVDIYTRQHRFEEPGTLELVMQLAADWFRKYLG